MNADVTRQSPGSRPVLAIRGFDGKELEKAGSVVKKFADQTLTLADAHGLFIMRERRTAVCWSTDRHLALTGVTGAALVI